MSKVILVIFSVLIILIVGFFAIGYFASEEKKEIPASINKCYPFPENVQGFECETIKEESLIKQTKFCTNTIIPSKYSCEVIYNSSDNKTKLTFTIKNCGTFPRYKNKPGVSNHSMLWSHTSTFYFPASHANLVNTHHTKASLVFNKI